MSIPHIKFGWISSNGLGGDSIADGRTDVGDCYNKKRWENKFIIAIFIRVAIIINLVCTVAPATTCSMR